MADQVKVDEDERDYLDQREDPNPQASPSEFPSTSDDPELVSLSPRDAPASGITQVHVINRALPNEGVPGCSVVIGTESAVANRYGNANLDLRNLADGSYAATFLAPDNSEDPIGPGFPANPDLSRIWRQLSSRVEIRSGAIVSADQPDRIVVRGSSVTVHLQPAWLRSPLTSIRPAPADMIVIHHTAGNLQGDLVDSI